MLPPAHGGRLIDRVLGENTSARRRDEVRDLATIQPVIDSVYDTEKLAIGAYSPLEGFMGREAYESVLGTTRLPNGLPWSIPILLAPECKNDLATLSRLKPGDDFGVLDGQGRLFATIALEERFPIDREALARSVYGTVDRAHPNVADIMALGDHAYAGKVQLLARLTGGQTASELTPLETRAEFERRGWQHVAAYQCRNPPHTAHEYLQRLTLEREDIDGLFVHPVVGRLKKGDYRPEIILAAYQRLLASYYPQPRVFLSGLSVTMRYAGPKAALFFAIVRKNYGCSHYIVGRDQAGVGKYYDPYACHRIFDEFDVGITPLRYEETYYCKRCGWMATPKTCAHSEQDRLSTSQTRIRAALANREPLPVEIIRPEVAEILQGSENVLS